jgi:hypothetical protein
LLQGGRNRVDTHGIEINGIETEWRWISDARK